MKQSFLNSIKISALALIIGLGVSAVSAWTAPTVNPPATGTVKSPSNDTAKPVAAAINLSIFDQIKRGGITIKTLEPLLADQNGKLVSPLSFFKKVLLPNVDTSVYIGGASFADPSFASSFPGNRDVPMTIDLTGRAKINDAILFKTDVACAQPTKIINSSASAFEFWNTAGKNGNGDNADLLANGIRLDGGSPAAGKILISVDGDGRAVWATPKLAANGKDIIFDTYSDSPVGICGTPQSCPAGTTGTYPNCVTSASDLCTNIELVQTIVPTGMVKDTTGNIPGNCTYPSNSDPVALCGSNQNVYFPNNISFRGRDLVKDCSAGSLNGNATYNNQSNMGFWFCKNGTSEVDCSSALQVDGTGTGGGPGNTDNGDGLDCDVNLDGSTTDCI